MNKAFTAAFGQTGQTNSIAQKPDDNKGLPLTIITAFVALLAAGSGLFVPALGGMAAWIGLTAAFVAAAITVAKRYLYSSR